MNEVIDEVLRKERRNLIVAMQKAIVNSISDYQMEYGTGTVAWNCYVSFSDNPEAGNEKGNN